MPEAPWGPETAKAIENFPISGQPVPWELISALLSIKAAAAVVNGRLKVVPADVADAVHAAAVELLANPRPEWFPVDVFQTGSGTSTNMNLNEVLAGMAADRVGHPVHPNDHVNASQSSNDVFPSAVRIATVVSIVRQAEPALAGLERALRRQARRHASVVKAGRTHLMDAAPITFGDELAGWARQIRLGRDRLTAVLPRLSELPLGGSAVGTGLNVPRRFPSAVIGTVAVELGLPFREAEDHLEAQSCQDVLTEASGIVKVVALSLHKIAGDLRLLASGPHAGLAELSLPELQKGSSIMPGKVNPVIPEAVQQVCAQVVGNDAAITFASTLSTLQLNTAMPVIARNLLESLRLVTAAAGVLADKCVDGLVVDESRMGRYAESSSAVVTALVPLVGYDRAAEIAKQAAAEGRTIREVVADDRSLDPDRMNEALDLLRMARGGITPARTKERPRSGP